LFLFPHFVGLNFVACQRIQDTQTRTRQLLEKVRIAIFHLFHKVTNVLVVVVVEVVAKKEAWAKIVTPVARIAQVA